MGERNLKKRNFVYGKRNKLKILINKYKFYSIFKNK